MNRALPLLCLLGACEIDNPNYRPFDLSTPPFTIPDLRVVSDLSGTSPMTFAGYGSFVAAGTCTGTVTSATVYDAIDSTRPPCSACRCDTPTGCTTRLSAYPNNFCSVGPAMTFPVTPPCVNLNVNSVTYPGFVVDPPQAICNPSQAQVAPDVQVKRRGQLCLAAGKVPNCNTVACVQQQADGGNLCVAFNDAATPCPAPFGNRVRWSTSYTDNRTCTCTCDGAGCGGTVALSGKPDCPMGADSATLPYNMCTLFSTVLADPPKSVRYTPQGAASCVAKGQVSAGTPSLGGGLTLCCKDPL